MFVLSGSYPRVVSWIGPLVIVAMLCALAIGVGGFAPSASAAPGDAPVTGSLYVDLDRDGLFDPGEDLADTDSLSPPAGVTVTAFDATGASVACAVTAGAPPTYSCPVAGLTGSSFRVEFGLDAADEAAGWATATRGDDYGTSVPFVGPGDVADWATVPPSECPTSGEGFDGNANSADGKIFTTCFVQGDRDSGGPQEVVVGVNYDQSGAIEKLGMKGDEDNATDLSSELGAVWGIAYDEWNSTLFTSGILKRHFQLGSAGIDGLYWMDYPSGTWNSVSLGSLGGPSYGTVPARDLEGAAHNTPTYDVDVYSEVARMGIGDINVTPDGRTLLVTNLAAKTVEVYDATPTAAGNPPTWLRSIPIGNPGCSDAAANPDDYQVWALHTQDAENAYVGVTCTAEDSATGAADLEAHVVEIDIQAGSAGASVLTVPLDYARTCAGSNASGCGGATTGDFVPWNDVYDNVNPQAKPQPILSDLELTSDGSLVLGFTDRTGNQFGSANGRPTGSGNTDVFSAGELLHACNTSGDPDNPTFVLEGGAGSACDATANFADATGSNPANPQSHLGPAGAAEWYGEDNFANNATDGHGENFLGGLYVHPAFDEIVGSVYEISACTAATLAMELVSAVSPVRASVSATLKAASSRWRSAT